MEVPQGYKQTSVGIIPEDWKIIEFGNIATVSKTKYTPKDSESLKCIELEHINQHTGDLNGWTSSNFQKSTKNVFEKDDILFGKLRPYLRKYWLADSDGVCSSEIWVLKPKDLIISKFLFRAVQTHRFIQIANVSSGSKMPRADWDFVSQYPFSIPPLPEQQKIAEILSTWDTAIETCKQTIEQLKQRNKGLAQQLLSGKKRLEGFEDKEWNFVKFKEFYAPNKKPSGNAKFELLSVTKNGIVSQEKYFNKSIASEDTSKYLIVERGDFVVSGLNFWMGSYDVLSDFEIGMVSPAYKVFRLNEKYSKSFFKHLVGSRQMKNAMISSSVVGASIVRRNFDLEVLYEYAFKMPGIGEQEAIGNVLDAAQSELKIYEGKLQNLQQQKKGLMQQLLTGKVRTV